MFVEEYKLWNSWIFSFIQSLATSVVQSNILLTTDHILQSELTTESINKPLTNTSLAKRSKILSIHILCVSRIVSGRECLLRTENSVDIAAIKVGNRWNWCQYDGVLSHFMHAARIRLDAAFRDRCFGGRKGGHRLDTAITWLRYVKLFPWGHLKSFVYRTHVGAEENL
jgi:hypothetical protein